MSSINALKQSSETKGNLPELETTDISAKSRKSSFFLNPTSDTSNELIQLLLSELKEMRMEIKEIKEDGKEHQKSLKEVGENQKKLQENVGMMKMKQEDQNEKLENIEENQKKHQEEVRNDVTEIEKSLEDIRRNSQNDIRRRINGKWRNVQNENSYIWTKFEYDIFIVKLRLRVINSLTRYKLGVKHQNGFTASIENNKIVLKYLTDKGEEVTREEFSIENGRLVCRDFFSGEAKFEFIYERIGDPDSD